VVAVQEIHYNAVAKRADQQLAALGAQRLHALMLGDEDVGPILPTFKSWARLITGKLSEGGTSSNDQADAGSPCCSSGSQGATDQSADIPSDDDDEDSDGSAHGVSDGEVGGGGG
jgi:hypothetical protein